MLLFADDKVNGNDCQAVILLVTHIEYCCRAFSATSFIMNYCYYLLSLLLALYDRCKNYNISFFFFFVFVEMMDNIFNELNATLNTISRVTFSDL